MNNDFEKIIYDTETLKARIAEMGKTITADYLDKDPIVIGVLKGAFVFMADLIRAIDTPCEVEFLGVSSYGSGTTTTGAVEITRDLGKDIEGRHVIIVEDILDSGVTLAYLKKYLANRCPASIRICTLLDKPARRQADITPDYVGFTCPDEFIVGFGLDYAERYRNLPYIAILKREVYS
ncbi:MAG: hypoxanthine phosphoribosyltransferase [Oscillospiraceae bacterium]|nr:hypoxanthine phosphoribosyltransferase [Oscillospiraceae bacterium]